MMNIVYSPSGEELDALRRLRMHLEQGGEQPGGDGLFYLLYSSYGICTSMSISISSTVESGIKHSVF